MLGTPLHQVAIVDIIQRKRLNYGQAAMVLVDTEDLLQLFLPSVSVDRT